MQLGVEAVGQVAQLVEQADGVEHVRHLVETEVGAAEAHVVDDRAGEELDAAHERHCLAQRGQRHLPQVDAVELHRAGARRAQAEEDVDQRALAGPVGADEAHVLARPHGEGPHLQGGARGVRVAHLDVA